MEKEILEIIYNNPKTPEKIANTSGYQLIDVLEILELAIKNGNVEIIPEQVESVIGRIWKNQEKLESKDFTTCQKKYVCRRLL